MHWLPADRGSTRRGVELVLVCPQLCYQLLQNVRRRTFAEIGCHMFGGALCPVMYQNLPTCGVEVASAMELHLPRGNCCASHLGSACAGIVGGDVDAPSDDLLQLDHAARHVFC